MGKPFLSVIIPVYKVEKYLAQCVDSVLNQHISNYEVILIDDGSPDNCPLICDDYADHYSEITVIHQKNQGLSAARNAGIQLAKGDYIIFMDSDDWWNPEVVVPSIISKIRKYDSTEMFLFNSLDYIDGDGLYSRKEHNNLKYIRTDTVINYYKDLLKNGNLEVSACTKIIKRDFLIDNGLYFRQGLLGEDNEWMIRVLRVLKVVRIIEEPLYICRISRYDSITHTIKQKNVYDMLTIVSDSMEYCYKAKHNHALAKCELCFVSYLWFSALGISQRLDVKDRKDLMPKFKSTSSICKYSNSPKTKLSYTVYRLFGINITGWLLGRYIRIKKTTTLKRDKVEG